MKSNIPKIFLLVPCIFVATYAFQYATAKDESAPIPNQLLGAYLIDTGVDARLIVIDQFSVRGIGHREFIEGRISNAGDNIKDRDDAGSIVLIPLDEVVRITKIDSE